MTPVAEMNFFIATLKPTHVDLYVAIHESMPEIHRVMMKANGSEMLKIWRQGLSLFMLSVKGVANRELTEDEQLAKRQWHERTDPCFEKEWQKVQSLFSFEARELA